MREILFKAKRIDNGEWVEGYYIYHIKRTICPIGDSVKPEDEQHVIMQDGFSDWNMPRDTIFFNIDPETLCQYTGLNDKNCNRIWENDVVSINTYDYMEPEEDFFGKVIYAEGWGCWCIQQPDSEKPIPLCECEGTYQTDRLVEGNIFDNPELMKGE